MTDIIALLSNDERAVLMIAAQGQYMIPIGRWELPIKALTARGYMRMLDAVNYVITPAGLAASEAAEDDAIRGMINAGNRAYGA
jgi:hypothetical protein